MGQARATAQYWNVTTSNSAQANGPAEWLYVAVTGTLVLTSADGSTFTLSDVPAGDWIELPYAVTIIGTASTATGIVAAGWGASPQTS